MKTLAFTLAALAMAHQAGKAGGLDIRDFGALLPGVREGDPAAPPPEVRFDGCVLSPVANSSYRHLMTAK